MEWIADPTVWVGLATLVALEVVLGVDNLIFIAILADKLPQKERDRARIIGLSLALIMRLALLASISWVMSLTTPVFGFWRVEFSWRDLILIVGGLFLLVKATTEIHDRIEPHGQARPGTMSGAFWPIVAQIVVLDAVFSLDSIITAVGMVDELYVMMAAVIIAVAAMLVASKPLTEFITRRPSLIILCLGFLLMIGLVLVVDGLGIHIPKSHVYAAIGFSVLIEILNQLAARNRGKPAEQRLSRERLADAVLKMLGGVPVPAPAGGPSAEVFRPVERRMVREVLALGEKKAGAIMTPAAKVAMLDASAPRERILEFLRASRHREFPVAGDAPGAIRGIVRKEDVLALCVEGKPVDLAGIIRPALAVEESYTVLDVLEFFKRSPVELAVVVDSGGAFRGVVSRTDLLEAIAGDLPDRT